MKKLLLNFLYNVITVAILLGVLESGCHWFLRKIYNRDFDSSLIVDNKYFTSAGLKENAAGMVWGKEFHTDSFACRKNLKYRTGKKKWLFIGDSVTEGVGVNDSDTFASLVNRDNDSINVMNYSLIGYSVSDYYNVLRTVLNKGDKNIKKASIFFCLNDVYGPTPVNQLPLMAKQGLVGRLNSFLQQHYATYKLVKLVLYKNSDRYFKYDEQFYVPGNEYFTEAMSYLWKCDSVCKTAGVQMDVVILPYRSQLNGRDDKNDIPQVMLQDFCLKHHIAFSDLLPYLSEQAKLRELYLFADEIHFSAKGHKAIAEFIEKSL